MPTPRASSPPSPPPRRRSRTGRLFWALALLLPAPTIWLGLVLGGLALRQSPYIFRGVRVAGIDLGNQTRRAAEQTLQTAWRTTSVQLVADNGDTWPIAPGALGFGLDARALVEAAYAQGRGPAFPWYAPWRLAMATADLPPTLTPNWSSAEAQLRQLAPAVAREPIEAQLLAADDRVQAQPGAPGRALDLPATLALWQAGWAAGLAEGRLPLATTPLAPAVADLSAFVAPAEARLAQPLQLVGYDPVQDVEQPLAVPPETWRRWLRFDVRDGALRVSADVAAVADFLNEQSNQLESRYLAAEGAGTVAQAIADGQTAVELRLYHGSRQHTVQPGDTLAAIGRAYGIPYPWIEAANPGVGVLRPGQALVIPSPDDLLPLPVVRRKRIVVSLAQQRLWAYENGALKWEWPVSTGIAESPTAPGIFQVQSHEREAYANSWDLYMPYFMGIYLPAPNIDFMNGFHGFPTRDGVNLLWTNSLGRPATYGCILVDNRNVVELYNWAEQGVIVEVRQ